ncbi:MAG: hypothetical protein R3E97_20945 [Candidatus Eisenbacteria bacterium]
MTLQWSRVLSDARRRYAWWIAKDDGTKLQWSRVLSDAETSSRHIIPVAWSTLQWSRVLSGRGA